MIFKKLLEKFAAIVLDLDETAVPAEQVSYLKDHASHLDFDIVPDDTKEFLELMKKKHAVDYICISKTNGNVIASSNGSSSNFSITATAMFNYIQSELPKSQVIFIKEKTWFIIMEHQKKVYIVKAASNLSPIEMKILADDFEKFMENRENEKSGESKQEIINEFENNYEH